MTARAVERRSLDSSRCKARPPFCGVAPASLLQGPQRPATRQRSLPCVIRHLLFPTVAHLAGRDLDPTHMEAQADGDRRKPAYGSDNKERHSLAAMQVVVVGNQP